ncbi:hypothetical protein C8J57DRAFT_1139413, partial [Mycena rebaudengoi]
MRPGQTMPRDMAGSKHTSHADSVAQQGKMAVQMLGGISKATNIPYVEEIAGAARLLMDTFIAVRTNKADCLRMAEQVCTIITAVASICNSANFELSPSVLRNIATFYDTLIKVLSFVRRQVRGSLIRRVVRHLEDSALLLECQGALEHSLGLFQLQCEVTTMATLARIDASMSKNHTELLHLAMARDSSSTLGTLRSSLSDISLLPGSPKIFHGRDAQLQQIVFSLLQDDDPARVAILGPGGVGKSALSLAALYHPDIVAKFGSERHFISCETSQSAADVATALSNHFLLEGQGNPMQAVLDYLLSRQTFTVVVLDNMETPWEGRGGRRAVENFLSHLSSIGKLHLIITMRGEERPEKVRWTRPFIRPLPPLSDVAARKVFCDITDAVENDNQIEELLRFTDNLPLAVTLMASLVSFEGPAAVLDRWSCEGISVLSEGFGKRSNLSTSIAISLASPRLTAIPDALTLLSLLAVLPDGVTDLTLAQMGMPIADIPLCRVTLCRTSLAYVDQDRRLKTLVPIREHMLALHPPAPPLLECMRAYFYALVSLFCSTWARAV